MMGRYVLVPEVGLGWQKKDRYVGRESVRMEFRRDVSRMLLNTATQTCHGGYGDTSWKVDVAQK